MENETLTQEIENETVATQEAPETSAEKAERQKSWSERSYFILNQISDKPVAVGLASEKDCKKWIASNESEFDVPYVIGYQVIRLKQMVKSQKTIVK